MHSRCPRTGRFNTFILVDDGTMDTVVACSECNEEQRFNFDPGPHTDGDELTYNDFVDDCLADARESHEEDTNGR